MTNTKENPSMNDFDPRKPNAGDPRLTAFALGELEGGERDEVAAAVAADPALQAAVEEVRAAASQLTAALQAEPLPEPVDPVRLAPYRTVRPARFFPFPYWAVAGLAAAACFALILARWEGPQVLKPAWWETGRLAARTKAEQKAAGVTGPGPHQASNHIEIQFPGAEAVGGAPTLAAQPGSAEQWGVVVTNPPETGAGVAAPAAGGAPVAALAAGEKAIQQPRAPAVRGRVAAVPSRDGERDLVAAAQNGQSAFPIEVDTASYATVRRFLQDGRRPPRDAVRVEGLVNYFTYDYAAPRPADQVPFAASLEAASAPWMPSHRLVRIGLKARAAPSDDRSTAAPVVVAREVSAQVNFNPARVQAYRLIGYEDGRRSGENSGSGELVAGEVGAGHAVTALYEVVPVGVAWQPGAATDVVKYQIPGAGDRPSPIAHRQLGAAVDGEPGTDDRGQWAAGRGQKSDAEDGSAEILTVRIRYQAPDSGADRSAEFPLVDRGTAFAEASSDFRFAAAVAGFGLVLRDSPPTAGTTLSDVLSWAQKATGPDADHRRGEFISLVKRAGEILPVSS
jgi:hypothetical protein